MFEYRPAHKPQHKRNKPFARQRGAITAKVRKELHVRSGGLCEREECIKTAVHAAHVTRRWKLQETTVNNLVHLCVGCHIWADTTAEGRAWLRELEGSGEHETRL